MLLGSVADDLIGLLGPEALFGLAAATCVRLFVRRLAISYIGCRATLKRAEMLPASLKSRCAGKIIDEVEKSQQKFLEGPS